MKQHLAFRRAWNPDPIEAAQKRVSASVKAFNLQQFIEIIRKDFIEIIETTPYLRNPEILRNLESKLAQFVKETKEDHGTLNDAVLLLLDVTVHNSYLDSLKAMLSSPSLRETIKGIYGQHSNAILSRTDNIQIIKELIEFDLVYRSCSLEDIKDKISGCVLFDDDKEMRIEIALDILNDTIDVIYQKRQSAEFERFLSNAPSLFNNDIIIFSIGSAGTDEAQQYPPFARDLTGTQDAQKVITINIDPCFSDQEKILISKTDVLYYAFTLGLSESLSGLSNAEIGSMGLMHRLLSADRIDNEFIGLVRRLLNSHKRVILIDHTCPEFSQALFKISRANQALMGDQLEIIGSYFQDIPVFIYNSGLFASDLDRKQLNASLKTIWDTWNNRYNPSVGPEHGYNVFTTQELNEFRAQHQSIGTLYRNLSSIRASDLFRRAYHPNEPGEELPPITPMIGLSGSEPSQRQAPILRLLELQATHGNSASPVVEIVEDAELDTTKSASDVASAKP